MKKKYIFNFLIIAVFLLGSKASAADDKKLTHQDLFGTKCSKCHSTDQAKKMHKSEKDFIEIIKKMIGKGAKIKNDEAKKIAAFLGTPSRQMFEDKCTKCHTLDRVVQAHKNGTLNKETLKKMKKKGADINEKEIESIYDAIGQFYYYAPTPVPPGAM